MRHVIRVYIRLTANQIDRQARYQISRHIDPLSGQTRLGVKSLIDRYCRCFDMASQGDVELLNKRVTDLDIE